MLHRTLLCFALVSGLGLSSAAAAGAAAPSDVLKVTLDQAKIAKVPTGTTTLVVGNPSIADVTMLKGGVGMVVTGKGYGQTNLVAIDAQGNILDEKQIEVTPTRSVLVVQRGDARSSYTLIPGVCRPSNSAMRTRRSTTRANRSRRAIRWLRRNHRRQIEPAPARRARLPALGKAPSPLSPAPAAPMRRLIVEEPLSRAAVWSGRTATFATATAIVSVGIARLGGRDPTGALAVFGASLALAFLALLLAASATVMIWRTGRRGVRRRRPGSRSRWRSSPIRRI